MQTARQPRWLPPQPEFVRPYPYHLTLSSPPRASTAHIGPTSPKVFWTTKPRPNWNAASSHASWVKGIIFVVSSHFAGGPTRLCCTQVPGTSSGRRKAAHVPRGIMTMCGAETTLWESQTKTSWRLYNYVVSRTYSKLCLGAVRTSRATGASVQPGVHLRGLRAAAGL